MIELKNVYKDFDVYNGLNFTKSSTINILNNISYLINRKDSLGIIGKNGSGKSTLLKILFGAILPDKGSVKLEGKQITNEDTLNRFSFFGNNDRSFFWRLSVEDNLEYFRGVYKKEENSITELLFENLSIYKFAKRPFGNLSSGEKKKVILYRGLLKNPDILLFDEFTQSLDLPSKKEIERIIKALQYDFDKTILWVTHDLDEIYRLCTSTILIKDGTIKNRTDLSTRNFEDLEHFQKIITAEI